MPISLRVDARVLVAVAVMAFGAVALALLLQHGFGYEPCPWCTLQRLIYLLIGLAAAIALLLRGARRFALAAAALVPLAAIAGAFSAWHQHTVSARSDSCALTFADRLMSALWLPELWPAMFEARARCDEANLPWLGVPFSLWSLAMFVALAVLGLRAFRSRPPTLFLK